MAVGLLAPQSLGHLQASHPGTTCSEEDEWPHVLQTRGGLFQQPLSPLSSCLIGHDQVTCPFPSQVHCKWDLRGWVKSLTTWSRMDTRCLPNDHRTHAVPGTCRPSANQSCLPWYVSSRVGVFSDRQICCYRCILSRTMYKFESQ